MYVVIWEFIAKKGLEDAFVASYGPEGAWVTLFRSGEGYIGTMLLHDTAARERYVTIDQWKSKAAYDAFRARYIEEYQQIDKECAGLTEHEALIGTFKVSDEV